MKRRKPLLVEPQLDDSALEALDCGPAACVVAIDDASYGRIKTTTEEIRRRAGNVKGTTTPEMWKRAIDSFADDFIKLGLHPPRTSIVRGRDTSALWKLLKKQNRRIIGAIHYGTVANKKRRLWASRSYRGNHAVYFRGAKLVEGDRKVPTYDSLADGRFAGVPKGRKLWPFWLVKAALGNVRNDKGGRIYPRADRWIGLVISKAKPLTEPDDGIDVGDPDAGTPDDADVLELIEETVDAVDLLEDTAEQLAMQAERLAEHLPPDSTSTSDAKEGVTP